MKKATDNKKNHVQEPPKANVSAVIALLKSWKDSDFDADPEELSTELNYQPKSRVPGRVRG